ncbi:MAG: aminoglycoside phosphotransferase family protein [Rhodobacteraceae bacterium]|jgi:Phosphotransferase enzyme family|nr:aminoglycoside phosphotransferase family protein [Paracoccaceae bacterium]
MTAQTRPDETQFHKRYPSALAAGLAARRSKDAQAAGVPTPDVVRMDRDQMLAFRRIVPQGQASLPQMLDVVARVQAMPVAGLARFDPFLRIRPRLIQASARIAGLVARLETQDRALNWPANSVVHGDFHPGQVLRDATGKVWLIDLDDLALGPPEVDAGNLAAWLATQGPGDLAAMHRTAFRLVRALSPQADADLLAHFCAIAVVRRALKLAEKGQPWALDQLERTSFNQVKLIEQDTP